jgi:FtsZ-binding cell division protein ZapB
MDPKLKKILRGISLEIRRLLEGHYDGHGDWHAGDLEQRLNQMGVWRDRTAKPIEELKLSPEDEAARRLVDGYLKLREEAGVGREEAVSEFVRESAYTWANRLFALRCMEARGIIDEVILQKDAYGGRSLVHNRYGRKNPEACAGADDGLFAVLFQEFTRRAQELPMVFDPESPAVALRPSIPALKRTIALLSGRETVRGQDAATDEVFAAPDAFGWAYQYWNAEEKERVFKMVRTKKDAKIQGADIVPATQLYTEPYMVKFLVQNSLGALWMGMYPDSKLCEKWEYYVKDADRAPVTRKPACEITFLDPALGSGHFHLEAFDLFYAMYEEEGTNQGRTITPREICATILNHNLYGIDIDGRAVQIATAALWMKAKESATEVESRDLTSFHEHLVATNIRLPKGKDHLELFLHKHPEDEQLRPALELVFQGLEHADELGALLQIEELVDAVLRRLKEEADKAKGTAVQTGLFERTQIQTTLPVAVEDYDRWKRDALNRLQAHFEAEAQAADPVQAFFGESAGKGLAFFNVLSRRYDVVAANPPYLGDKKFGSRLKVLLRGLYPFAWKDLLAAFVVRQQMLAKPGGISAHVTQHALLTLDKFTKLRGFLLSSATFECVCPLGPRAFSEITGEVVNVTLCVTRASKPSEQSEVLFIDVSAEAGPERKAAGIIRALNSGEGHQVKMIPQAKFTRIPSANFGTYWLPSKLFELLVAGHIPLETVTAVTKGLKTGQDKRFVRFFWEVGSFLRWARYHKGGGYCKWTGNDHWCVDWGSGQSRVKLRVEDTLPPEKFTLLVRDERYYEKTELVFSAMGGGAFGVRLAAPGIASDASQGLIPLMDNASPLEIIGALNTRPTTAFVRALAGGRLSFDKNYVQPAPFVGPTAGESVSNYSTICLGNKKLLCAANLSERAFDFQCLTTAKVQTTIRLALELELHCAEGEIERAVLKGAGLTTEETRLLLDVLGTPVAWLPALDGLDKTPNLKHHAVMQKSLENCARVPCQGDELRALKERLRNLFESLATPVEEDLPERVEGEGGDLDDDEDDSDASACLSIPVETDLERLSKELGVHPISVYWLLNEGIEREGWRCPSEERRITEDRFTVLVLRLLGHCWPKQLEAVDPLASWADQEGVILLTKGGSKTHLIEHLGNRLAEEFPGCSVAALEREFEVSVGVSVDQWLAGPFFERHISQFRKRPIAWQIETDARGQMAEGRKKKRGEAAKPVFACLIYYHKLDEDLLPKIRTQYIGVLRSGYETELRTLERLPNPTADQQGRKLQLDQWIEEMKAFDGKLEQVSLTGFGPPTLRPALRQYAINDALLSLTAAWLGRLNETVASGPLKKWLDAAAATNLHPEFPRWMEDSLSHLDHFCAVLGPTPPKEDTFTADPTSPDLAPLVCRDAKGMVKESIKLACARWWKPLDEAVLEPLRQEMKAAKDEIEKIDIELKTTGLAFQRRNELGEQKHELKQKIKKLKGEHDEKSSRGKHLREEIEGWTCPEAETWEPQLSEQPLFDKVASLDGKRQPPQTLAEFIAQESAYVPDINDGVRVNIAPVQKAGLLHADVLDSKDADKAIADRAEWRSDERRWVREGKLPQPGWWESKKSTT